MTLFNFDLTFTQILGLFLIGVLILPHFVNFCKLFIQLHKSLKIKKLSKLEIPELYVQGFDPGYNSSNPQFTIYNNPSTTLVKKSSSSSENTIPFKMNKIKFIVKKS